VVAAEVTFVLFFTNVFRRISLSGDQQVLVCPTDIRIASRTVYCTGRTHSNWVIRISTGIKKYS